MAMNFGVACAIVAGSLAVGAAGYHGFEGLPWLDATLNAAMILGGMGPVDPIRTEGGKVFATVYALYSGLALLTITAVVLAPVVHRFLHKFHLVDKT
jgi:hypothetical protein